APPHTSEFTAIPWTPRPETSATAAPHPSSTEQTDPIRPSRSRRWAPATTPRQADSTVRSTTVARVQPKTALARAASAPSGTTRPSARGPARRGPAAISIARAIWKPMPAPRVRLSPEVSERAIAREVKRVYDAPTPRSSRLVVWASDQEADQRPSPSSPQVLTTRGVRSNPTSAEAADSTPPHATPRAAVPRSPEAGKESCVVGVRRATSGLTRERSAGHHQTGEEPERLHD